jgi:protoporphyrinogen IX oxidase
MTYLYLKALHVIAIVCWYAGLFYLPRLFVYDIEANGRNEPERSVLHSQLGIMQRRLYYGIMWPAMVVAWCAGIYLMVITGAYREPWFHFKFSMVILLTVFHLFVGKIRKQLVANNSQFNSKQMRIINEIPGVFLIGIVVTVYLKNAMSMGTVAGLVILSLAVMAALVYSKKTV